MAITSRTAAIAAVLVAAVICLVNVELTAAQMMVPAAAPAPYVGGGGRRGVYAPAPGPYMEGGAGGVSAPPPGPDCPTILMNASDCLLYFSPGSSSTAPNSACCSEFESLVKNGGNDSICLCDFLSNPISVGFNISVKKALMVPSLCGLKLNPVGLCNFLGIPIPTSSEGPAMSPGPAPASGNSSGSAALSPSPATGATGNLLPSPPKSGATRISISQFGLAFSVGLAVAFLLPPLSI